MVNPKKIILATLITISPLYFIVPGLGLLVAFITGFSAFVSIFTSKKISNKIFSKNILKVTAINLGLWFLLSLIFLGLFQVFPSSSDITSDDRLELTFRFIIFSYFFSSFVAVAFFLLMANLVSSKNTYLSEKSKVDKESLLKEGINIIEKSEYKNKRLISIFCVFNLFTPFFSVIPCIVISYLKRKSSSDTLKPYFEYLFNISLRGLLGFIVLFTIFYLATLFLGISASDLLMVYSNGNSEVTQSDLGSIFGGISLFTLILVIWFYYKSLKITYLFFNGKLIAKH